MLPGIGIFGIDESTVQYIKNFQKQSFIIWGICGSDIDLLNYIAKEYNIPLATLKTDELLLHQEINLILFMNDEPNNYEYISKALKIAGKHVICCRTLSLSSEKAYEMYESSLKYPILLSSIENPLRYNISFKRLKDYIQSKVIGDLLYCDCMIESSSLLPKNCYNYNYEVAAGGGLLQKIGIFVIDALLFAFAMKIGNVLSTMRTMIPIPDPCKPFLRSDADDYFSLIAKMTNGNILNINARSVDGFEPGYYKHIIKCVGQLGSITLQNNLITIKMSDEKQDRVLYEPEHEFYCFPPMNDDYQIAMIAELKSSFACGKYNPDKTVIEHLLTFKEGVILRNIIDAAFLSNQSYSWCLIYDEIYIDKYSQSPLKQIETNRQPDAFREASKASPVIPISVKSEKTAVVKKR